MGLINEDTVKSVINAIRKELDNQKYIMKVKVISEPRFYTANYGYDAVVTEVFKGDDVSVGEEIFATRMGFKPILKSDNWRWGKNDINLLNCGYKNLWKEGEEYLVIFKDRQDCLVKDNVFIMEGFTLLSAFNCAQTKSEPVKSVMEGRDVVRYPDVKDYELFASEQGAIDAFYAFKDEMLQKYS